MDGFLTHSNLSVVRGNEWNFEQVKDISVVVWDILIGKAFYQNWIWIKFKSFYYFITVFILVSFSMFMGCYNSTKKIADLTSLMVLTIILQRSMVIGKFLLWICSVNNCILLTKYISADKNISMQLWRYVHAFLKYPLGPKGALDFKYNFILFMAIFPLSEAMAKMATKKFEPWVKIRINEWIGCYCNCEKVQC